MESIISLGIIFGIPVIFLVLCVINIIQIIKAKKDKTTVKKSSIIFSIIFGVFFILIVGFYTWVSYLLSKAIANM